MTVNIFLYWFHTSWFCYLIHSMTSKFRSFCCFFLAKKMAESSSSFSWKWYTKQNNMNSRICFFVWKIIFSYKNINGILNFFCAKTALASSFIYFPLFSVKTFIKILLSKQTWNNKILCWNEIMHAIKVPKKCILFLIP